MGNRGYASATVCLLLLGGCSSGSPPGDPGAPGGAPPGSDGGTSPRAVFQPAFHQSLPTSESAAALTTFRLKVPVGRAGNRLRVTLRAGDGALTVTRVTVAHAGSGGVLLTPVIAVTFGGSSASRSVAAREHLVSDPVALPVSFGEDLYVSWEAKGALAAATWEAFPDSYVYAGSHASETMPAPGSPHFRAVGLETIEVEAPRELAVLAVGDSITEGYITGRDDFRQSWTSVARARLLHPVVGAGISGEHLDHALQRLDDERLHTGDVTDCVVLHGTNDLGTAAASLITSRLAQLYDKLRPHCRVWAGTLLPKERTSWGDYEQVKAERRAVNEWLRTQAQVGGVIDFEGVMRAADSADRFAPGLGGPDGIHPSAEGHRVMGEEAARVLGAPPRSP